MRQGAIEQVEVIDLHVGADSLVSLEERGGQGERFAGRAAGVPEIWSRRVVPVVSLRGPVTGIESLPSPGPASRSSATSTLNPCSSRATTVAASVCSSGSAGKRSRAWAVVTGGPLS